jgi:hypothetical protein
LPGVPAGYRAAQLRTQLAAREAELAAKQAEWEASQASPTWTELEPTELKASMNATFAKQPDHSVLVEGPNGRGTYTVVLGTDLADVTAIRLELLADAKLPGGGPGRAVNGNLALSELRATAAAKSDPAKSTPLKFGRTSADFSQENLPVASAVDGKPNTHWAIHPQVGKDHYGIFEIADDLNFAGGTLLTLALDHQLDEQHTIGKFRVAVTSAKRPLNLETQPQNIAAILAVAPQARSDAQKAELVNHYRLLDADWVRLSRSVQAIAELAKNERLAGAQDLAWALINSPAFLFNR